MNGVYAAIVTHFDSDLDVDHDAVAAEVHRLIDGGIHGIVPNGTVGEGGSLSRDERREVIETVVGRGRRAGPGVRRRLGIDRRAGRRLRARRRGSAGADGVMTLPPLLYRADRRELIEFFTAVAARRRPAGDDLQQPHRQRLATSSPSCWPRSSRESRPSARSRSPPATPGGSPSSSTCAPTST